MSDGIVEYRIQENKHHLLKDLRYQVSPSFLTVSESQIRAFCGFTKNHKPSYSHGHGNAAFISSNLKNIIWHRITPKSNSFPVFPPNISIKQHLAGFEPTLPDLQPVFRSLDLTCSEVFIELMMLGRLIERVASDFERGLKESSREDFLLGESVGAGDGAEGGVGPPDCLTMSSPDFRLCRLPEDRNIPRVSGDHMMSHEVTHEVNRGRQGGQWVKQHPQGAKLSSAGCIAKLGTIWAQYILYRPTIIQDPWWRMHSANCGRL